MSTLGGTGCAVSAEPADQQKTHTELEMEASLRQAARRNTRLYGTSPKNAGTNVIEVEFGPTGNISPMGVQRGGPSGAARDATGPTGPAATDVGNVTKAEVLATVPANPADFMAKVVVWPTAGNGVINAHWSFTDRQGIARKGMGGKPFGKLADLLAFIPWANANPGFIKDLYFCLSQQAETGPLKAGKLRALRTAVNATYLKALWLDIDGNKTPPKGYPSKDAALDAVVKFCKDAAIPFPNAIVDSGNGLHAYWISDRALLVDEWRMYATGLWALVQKHGLLADPVTTDAARVLRIPGTWNHKSVPPKPVKLVRLEPEYDFKSSLGALVGAQGHAPVQPQLLPSNKPSALMLNPALFPKKAPITDEKLAPDCVRPEVVLDGISIAEQCPHFRDALVTGGKDHNQGLWMQTVLASTFMEQGHKLAHKMSDKHPGYSPSETDKMFERKVTDREQRGLGWPSCKAFESNGCKLCATCKHFDKIRSPLNLGRPGATIIAFGPTETGAPTGTHPWPNSDPAKQIVPKDDHMGRARIYRNEQRPNLYHYRDDFYDYEGGHYVMVDDHTIEANLYGFLDKCKKKVSRDDKSKTVPFEPDTKSIHETINALKAVGHVLPTVEQPYWLGNRTGPDPSQLICFPNGILNLSTNGFKPPDPTLFTSHGVAFGYDPNAPKPVEWLKFLDQIFGGEQDQIDALQEIFGYCISSDVSQEKAFLLIGPKRSGKDTIRHTLQSSISPKAVCGPTLDSMGSNFGMSAFIGKQLAIVGDMRLGSKCDKDLLAENILKLSGRGLFTIDRKHKDHWTGPLPCKLLLISNEMPKFKDTSGALASRTISLQTRVSFYGREDPNMFRDKIAPELPGILNWSLEGLRRLRQRGSIAEPACSIEAREELAREGSPIMAFVQECLTLDPKAIVSKDAMYSTYLDYAEHNGLHPGSKSWFFRDLETATAGKVKAERVQQGGKRVHNIRGAKISSPPPLRRQWNGNGGVPQPPAHDAAPAQPAPATAGDIGEPDEADAELEKRIQVLAGSKGTSAASTA